MRRNAPLSPQRVKIGHSSDKGTRLLHRRVVIRRAAYWEVGYQPAINWSRKRGKPASLLVLRLRIRPTSVLGQRRHVTLSLGVCMMALPLRMITLSLGLATTYFGSAGTTNRSVMYRVEDDVAGGIMPEDLLSTIGMRGSLPLPLPC